jgi:RNA polymerase sigma-70 factor, ECF subfamily
MQRRSEETFVRVFSKERNRLYRFIFMLVPSEADAEDIFQQTSITLWKKFAEFDQSREFYPWACGVAFRTVQNFRRSAKRKDFVLGDDLVRVLADEQTISPARELHRVELIKECLTSLKQSDRDLVGHVYHDGTPAGTIAERLGRSTQTIYNRLNVIRKMLLDCVNRKSQTC